jgi:glycosyltransferase involved in cell wall biosynthesis
VKILLINHRDPKHPFAGGAEEYIFQIGRRLVKRGHEVTLLAERPSGLSGEEIIEGIRVIRMGGFLGFHAHAPNYVRQHGPEYDVVVDSIAHVFPFFSGFFTRTPVVAVVHHINGSALRKIFPAPLVPLAFVAENLLAKAYRNYIAVSKSTKNDLVRLGVRGDVIRIVYSGIDHEIYRPGEKAEEPTAIWIGRFVKYKNPDHVVKAFSIVQKKIPSTKLIMVGSGPLYRQTVRLAKNLNVNVEFVGRIPLKEKIDYLQKAWICIYTSEIEGFGIAALEAAACGTPCVGYSVGGLREAIIHGRTGYLVPKGDILGIAEVLVKILSSIELVEELSREALRYSMLFDWERSAEEFEKALKEIAWRS